MTSGQARSFERVNIFSSISSLIPTSQTPLTSRPSLRLFKMSFARASLRTASRASRSYATAPVRVTRSRMHAQMLSPRHRPRALVRS